MQAAILRTKLYKPRPRQHLTPRPELLQKLNARIDSDLTLIVAPVGFGKTTTVAAWCVQAPLPVAWLTLDENDNEPARFLTYVIAAIRTLAPEACPETSGVLRAGHALEVAALTTLLANEIDDLPERFALVLDDYHCIKAPLVHQLVDGLLRHPPLQLHLLIAGRTDPPLAIARLRANGRLNELRAGEFRFTRAETEHFLAGALTANADVRTTDLLIHSLDGWVAGLQLAALSLNTAPDQQMALRDLEEGRDRYIMEYLFEQVLQHQSPEVETFLLRTSILDRISPDLARAVVAVDLDGAEAAPTGAAVAVSLLWLEQQGLFTHALDSAGEWYSYHALFRELLRHRLRVCVTPEQIAALYRCACQWHRLHGQVDEALRYAFAADDTALAAQIVEEWFPIWLAREDWRTLEHWLDELPDKLYGVHPALWIAKAYVAQSRSNWNIFRHLLESAEMAFADLRTARGVAMQMQWRAHLDTLWALQWSVASDADRAERFAQQALEQLAGDQLRGVARAHLQGIAHLMLVTALQSRGHSDRARQMIEAELLRAPRTLGSARSRLRVLLELVFLEFAEGEIAVAARIATGMLQEAVEFNVPVSQIWAHLALGVAAYEFNQLAEAATHFTQCVELPRLGHSRGRHECLIGLALTYQALGRKRDAERTAASLLDYDYLLVDAPLIDEGRSLKCRLQAQDGLDPAEHQWLSDVAPNAALWFGWQEIPAVTAIRVALGTHQAAYLHDANRRLDALLALAMQLHKTRYLVNLFALKAAVCEQLGQRQAALAALAQAVAVGQPRNMIRAIADAGPALAPLLRARQITAPSRYLDDVLAALTTPRSDEALDSPATAASQQAQRLTRREREVLALLAQHLTDREIAEQLVISPLTVRTHIEHLAEKLGVSGRRAIVARAAALNILT